MVQLVGVGPPPPPKKTKKKNSILVYSYDCVSYGFNTQPSTILENNKSNIYILFWPVT